MPLAVQAWNAGASTSGSSQRRKQALIFCVSGTLPNYMLNTETEFYPLSVLLHWIGWGMCQVETKKGGLEMWNMWLEGARVNPENLTDSYWWKLTRIAGIIWSWLLWIFPGFVDYCACGAGKIQNKFRGSQGRKRTLIMARGIAAGRAVGRFPIQLWW